MSVPTVYAQTNDQKIVDLQVALEEMQINIDELQTANSRVEWDLFALLEYENFEDTTSEFDVKYEKRR